MIARRFLKVIPQRTFGAIPTAELSSAAAAAAPNTQSAFKASVAPNGVQIVSKDTHANLVSLKFAVLGGSSAEAEDEKGAAHLLSVAAFSGTGNKTGLRLMRELEDIGATVSASADREKITLNVTVLSSMAEMAFERLADTITSPPRNKFVLLDCHGAAQLAYDAMASNPKKKVVELLHEAAFGETSPMGASFLADHNDLQNLQPESVFKYRQHQFTASNLIVASAGLPHETLRKLTDKYLSTLPTASTNTTGASPYVGGDARLKLDTHGATYVALAFPVPAGGAAAKPFNVLRVMLTAKLAQFAHGHPHYHSHADTSDCASALSAFYAPYSGANGGLWGFFGSGASPTTANGHMETAIAALKAIGGGAVAADELEAAKNHLTVQKTAELESSEGTTSTLLASYLAKVSPADYVNYGSVSAADVSAAAKASLSANPSYVVVGKTAGAHSFAAIQKMLK